MRKFLAIVCVVVAVGVLGCARLRVNVDIYDGPIPITTVQARQLTSWIASEPLFNDDGRVREIRRFYGAAENAFVADQANRLESSAGEHAEICAQALWYLDDQLMSALEDSSLVIHGRGDGLQDVDATDEAEAPEGVETTEESDVGCVFAGTAVPSGVGNVIRKSWSNLDIEARKLRDSSDELAMRLALGNRPLSDEERIAYAALRSQIATFLNEYREFTDSVERVLRRLQVGSEALAQSLRAIPAVNADVLRSIASVNDVSGRAVGYPIFDARISSVIRQGAEQVDDEGSHWLEFLDDRFSAKWGNAQFVAVSEGLLVFHPKSLDFDPTPVIVGGKAVAKVGIEVASALTSGMTSLPLPASTAPDGSGESTTGAGAQQVVDLASLEIRKAILLRREHAVLETLADIADIQAELEGTAANDASKLSKLQKDLDRYIGYFKARITPAGP